MMPEILHRVFIDASSETIYNAITTELGLKSWWTTDSNAEPKVGTISRFGFPGHTTVFHMHIDKLVPPEYVQWTCKGDDEEWKDTLISFEIKPAGNNQCVLTFRHEKWKSTSGYYADCNTTWGHLMILLKQYCEGKDIKPYFS